MTLAYLKFNPDTIKSVRKEFNLHKPGEIEQSIDVLSDWVSKQEHFLKKDLPREYLERSLIGAKGSVEVAKKRIDRLFTMQTMVPDLFEKVHAIDDFPNLRNFYLNVTLPKLTEDNSRIHVTKQVSKTITACQCLESYQHLRITLEYGRLHDYTIGYHIIFDLSNTNIADAIGNVDWIVFRSLVELIIEGYGYRVLSVYMVSSSKMISALVKLVKQLVSEKIAKRINVINNAEELHEVLSKKCLPKDYGGELKPLLELYDEQNKELCSTEHLAHLQEMRNARTIEELRSSGSFNKEYLGMPGSFKMLSVD